MYMMEKVGLLRNKYVDKLICVNQDVEFNDCTNGDER
jgi:hypothetical protein